MIVSGVQAKKHILSGKRATAMEVEGELDLSGQGELKTLPRNLTCYELNISGTSI